MIYTKVIISIIILLYPHFLHWMLGRNKSRAVISLFSAFFPNSGSGLFLRVRIRILIPDLKLCVKHWDEIITSRKNRENAHNMGLSWQPPLKKKFNTVHNLITFSIVCTKKFFFFFRSKIFMNLYSKTFYILNFRKKKNSWKSIPKIRNLQVGLRVWSGGEIFSKKINKNRGHIKPPHHN